MDDFDGYDYSMSGFTDFIRCFHEVNPLWTAVGACIFVGTALSLVPQLIRIVRMRSSYGISSFFVLVSSLSQFFGVLNYFSLHAADFVGALQSPLSRSIPRELSFGNLFILWWMYLPLATLIIIFFDKEPRVHRKHKEFKKEWNLMIIFMIILVVVQIATFTTFIIFGFCFGFNSLIINQFGKFIGTVASLITVAQYLPQFITTYRLKDNGSLSLITLCIQAPGGTLNAIFMMVGNNDNWTTYLSTLSSAIQQWLLLILCFYYKIKQRRQRKLDEKLLNTNANTEVSLATATTSESTFTLNDAGPST